MTIPGHAPRPEKPADPALRHFAPLHRDAGLERVNRFTRWTVAGGLVMTGGFGVLAARTQAPHHSPTAVAPPGTTTSSTSSTSSVSTTTTAPAATPSDDGDADATTAPPATAPPTTTAPLRPATTAPATTEAAPVVTSGGS
jgi:hypothetical protein